MPVARETAETPPRPIAAHSAPATNRRDRSSKTPRTAAKRCVIPTRSIILSRIRQNIPLWKCYFVTSPYDLDRLQRKLLTKLGRHNEALEAAWADFRQHPSKYSYDDLMQFVPKAVRKEWHEKALNAAEGADLHSLLELLVGTKETERLAELVRGVTDEALEVVSHYASEPAARKLERTHPELAARLWRAQGMRIVDAKKSKYYDAALSNFERARDCYRRAGLAVEWDQTVRRVCASHHRKTGFMSGFEALAAGAKRREQPSFMDRARARWSERHGSE